MTIGMNWRIWNSVRANVEMKIPRLTAPSASRSATRKARPGEPALAIPRPIENAGSGPIAGTLSVAEREGHDHDDLERREEPEARAP